MKIAIMSDTHDNMPSVEKAIIYINNQKIKTIIHCGDLSSTSLLDEVIFPNFKGEFHMVYGNVSDPDTLNEHMAKYKKLTVHGNKGKLELDGIRMAFCHFPAEARELASTNDYHIVFYGHTHQPWEETIGSTKIVNPGTLAGMFYKASFAIYDTETDKLELKILEIMK